MPVNLTVRLLARPTLTIIVAFSVDQMVGSEKSSIERSSELRLLLWIMVFPVGHGEARMQKWSCQFSARRLVSSWIGL